MVFKIRKSLDRGHANHGWLDTYHSFSFANYYDPDHMGYRSLRVINEDVISAGMGFGTHGHRDMEILTLVLSGALEHKDSMGNISVIRAGELQRMSAGTGVRHSEYNHLKDGDTRLLQIWIQPDTLGLKPGYEELKVLDPENNTGAAQEALTLVASPDPAPGVMKIHQDAKISILRLQAGDSRSLPVSQSRGIWVQLFRGELNVQAGEKTAQLESGDGLAVSDISAISFQQRGDEPAEAIIFDLA